MIIFYCPLGKMPNGGHKVIYKTVELLNNSGVDAYIFHEIKNYKLKWFDFSKKVRFINKIPKSSHIIIPEVCLLNINKNILKNAYSILVQNGYYIFNNCESNEFYKKLIKIYLKAEHIYCVSSDTAKCVLNQFPDIKNKIVNFTPYINYSIFTISQKDYLLKKNIITIMIRKNPELASNIIKHLNYRLPINWKIIKIDRLHEKEVARNLKSSKIFINVPGFEGFPAPPIEAALAGNTVIGSTGNGAKVYWKFFKYPSVELGDTNEICKYVLMEIKKNNFFKKKNLNQNRITKFLSNLPQLNNVIEKNYSEYKTSINKIKKREEVVYRAKQYWIFIFHKILSKIF